MEILQVEAGGEGSRALECQRLARAQVGLRLRDGGWGIFSAASQAPVAYLAATGGALPELVCLFGPLLPPASLVAALTPQWSDALEALPPELREEVPGRETLRLGGGGAEHQAWRRALLADTHREWAASVPEVAAH